jgi:LPS sulfotransferase NodH
VISRVLAHLGIPEPTDFTAHVTTLSVQADEVSEEWVRRVNEHLAALEAPS